VAEIIRLMDKRVTSLILVALGVILVGLLLQRFLFYPSEGVVSSIEITPQTPVQGDLVTITVNATPNRYVPMTLYFSTNLTITNGNYEILLKGLKVPASSNKFKVSASGVKDLTVAVYAGVWLTKSSNAIDSQAYISQDNIPGGSYDVRIFGVAFTGASKVNIEIVATSSLFIEADGSNTYNYDTALVPAGSLQVVAGDVSRIITLLPGIEN
jgi:hypothetical protein